MKLVSDIRHMPVIRQPVFLAAGFFDGLHRGHVAVIEQAIRQAIRYGGQAWVLTFDIHPARIVMPNDTPPLITCNRHKLILLEQLNPHGCLEFSFTHKLSTIEPRRFIEQLHRHIPTLRSIYCGQDWRFGRKAAGDVRHLVRLGREMNFDVQVIQPVRDRCLPISSTRIRTAVTEGRLAEAARLLGRPVSILGKVEHGAHLGRTLGFPTANLSVCDELQPPPGVYATRVAIGKHTFDSVTSIGTRETFVSDSDARRVIEVHIFDLHRNLYGRDMEVFFLRKLRQQRAYPEARGLVAQIQRDVRRAKEILSKSK